MRRRFALALPLIATLSCSGDSPTESSGLSGTFDLSTIDGVAPPKLELVNMSGDSLFFTGSEVRVLSRGRASLVRFTRWHSSVNGPLPVDADTVVVVFRLTGSELLLDYPVSVLYGPYTDTATVQGDGIMVRTKVYGLLPGTVLVRNLFYHKR